MDINYIQAGEYFIPDLTLPAEHRPIGKWGRMHRDYLKEYHPIQYNDLVLSDRCVRRCKTTPRPSKSDTLTAEIRHSFRWSDSWYFRVETGLYVGPHAVWLSP